MLIRCWPLAFAYLVTFLFESDDFSYYLASWFCSIFILFFTFFGNIFPNTRILDFPMRPLVTTNIIFNFYMCITSIFYFLDANGYYYLSKNPLQYIDEEQVRLISQCQSYYLLAQLFFTIGLILGYQNIEKPIYKISYANISQLSFRITLIFSGFGFGINFLPGMNQFAVLFVQLSLVTSVFSLAIAIQEQKTFIMLISFSFFLANEYKAVISGWKEAILVPFILLGIFLFPYYKKTIIVCGTFFVFAFIYFIPTYNQTVRNLSWGDAQTDKETASKAAFEQLSSSNDDEISTTNWEFLTGRLSEIAMFTKYVSEVPARHEFYGFQIVLQGLESIVPRVFYPEKPITETLVMQRTIELNVISELSVVSAKPQTIADAYLSFGAVGVIFTFLLLGFFASSICAVAEKYFGGYFFGCCMIYTGLFLILWRGNCFEFMFNSLFWGVVLLYLLFTLGQKLKILTK